MDKIFLQYKLIKEKEAFIKMLAMKVSRSKHTVKVHWFSLKNIPPEFQDLVLKYVNLQVATDKRTNELNNEIWSK